MALQQLREVFGALPTAVYRAKGIVCLAEMPAYQVVLQMVGGRLSLSGGETWGSSDARSEIVMIATRGGIDTEAVQHALDSCRRDRRRELLRPGARKGTPAAALS